MGYLVLQVPSSVNEDTDKSVEPAAHLETKVC